MSAARRFASSALLGWAGPAELDVVVLLVSEVVTNVVVHAGPHQAGDDMVVSVSGTAEVARVEVTDGHPAVPAVGDGAVDRLGGRGMLLLDALASRWGVIATGPGKMVWFEVRA